MNAKKLSISIFLVIFILFGAVSAIAYNQSNSIDVVCYAGSYAEDYAKEHKIDYELISDSDAYVGVLNLENFDYNNNGEIVAYKGDSEKIAIPEVIGEVPITKISKDAFKDAKNLKTVYIPKTLADFGPKDAENLTLYMQKDAAVYKTLSEDKEAKVEIKTIPDSYYVNFYIADIPFSYNNISDKSVDLTKYNGQEKTILVPESIDGKIVTTISFDVLSGGIEKLIIPESVINIQSDLYRNRYDLTFVIGMLLALVGTVISVVFVITLKDNSKEKAFLTLSQYRAAYIVTVLSVILAALYLFVSVIPDIAIYIAFIIVLGVAVISVVKAKTAVAVVDGIDQKIKVQTFFIKSLTVDAEHLMSTAKTAELKTLTKKVYEAVRYSDPMSNAVLVEVEDKIQNGFTDFENAVEAQDFELASSTANELLSLIDIRNKKCKLLK